MDSLSLFGLGAVTLMLACYALEDRSPNFVLGFAAACAFGSAYRFLQGAWPLGWSRRSGRLWRLTAGVCALAPDLNGNPARGD
jgi:hypothetical protein